MCYMKEITHREMRNDSAAVLRRVADGESMVITNRGQPAAVIGPPSNDPLVLLAAQGRLREAIVAPSTLRSIKPKRSTKTTVEILDDTRGRW